MIADSSRTDSPNAARERFERDGYLIVRQLLEPSRVAELRALAKDALE